MTDPDPGPGGQPEPDPVRGRWRRRLVLGLVAVVGVVALAGLGFVVWASSTPTVGPDATAALTSDDRVVVTEDDGYVFSPTEPASVGLVLYPGGRVDPASYAVVARPVAEAGYLVVVPSVRLNLAVLEPNVADRVISEHPAINRWAVAGHSLGGAMAARFADQNRQRVAGLTLLAAFPGSGNDLSDADLAVTSVFGTADGLVSAEELDRSKDLLPDKTRFVSIDGGTHAQFGDYGRQSGDGEPRLPAAEQWDKTAEAIIAMLVSLE